MRTSIDTNIISALLNGEPAAEAISDVLGEYRLKGALVICGVVYAELMTRYSKEDLDQFFREVGIEVDILMSEDTWAMAANAWKSYLANRKKQKAAYSCPKCGYQNRFYCNGCGEPLGGPRFILADFLVGAFSCHNADILLTLEQKGGFYQTYLPQLHIQTV